MTVSWLKPKRKILGLLTVVLLASTACSVTADFGTPAGSGGGSSTRLDDVIVVFKNLTNSEAVDVEFHSTAEPLQNMPEDLFDPDNNFRILQGIGTGGSGRLAPGQEDSIKLDCSEDLALGTAGGTFVDNETGDERGRGNQQWLQGGGQFSCGKTFIFQFAGSGSSFTTEILIGSDDDETARTSP